MELGQLDWELKPPHWQLCYTYADDDDAWKIFTDLLVFVGQSVSPYVVIMQLFTKKKKVQSRALFPEDFNNFTNTASGSEDYRR